MQIEGLIDRLKETDLFVDLTLPEAAPDRTTSFDRVLDDSRAVGPNDCFVAIRGHAVDGHLFIDKAVKNGATVIVCEAVPGATAADNTAAAAPGAALVRVTDSRRALAELASLQTGDPGQDLGLFAVTGTNGKTTTASLIADALQKTGTSTGFIGTTGIRVQDQLEKGTHTTPSPLTVYELLATMKRHGRSACSMEASSHAIDQHRIRPVDVDVAVFTNLTRDHLDYHGSFDAYRAAKKQLFDELTPDARAVTNADDTAGPIMTTDTAAEVVTYGTAYDARISYRILGNDLAGLRLEIDGRSGRFRLGAAFNAANLTAAYTALVAYGTESGSAFSALQECDPVRGRFERIRFDDGTVAIIDYAHTPDALQNVLGAVRQATPPDAAVWCLFGCGGDRDRGKRPQMGAVAERLADHLIITSDNPRSEDPEAILNDICDGLKRPDRAARMADRAEAIRYAADSVRPGDALLVAGKGHETVQVIGDRSIDFDDRDHVLRAFASTGRTARTD